MERDTADGGYGARHAVDLLDGIAGEKRDAVLVVPLARV
jgi:hypothetical protein